MESAQNTQCWIDETGTVACSSEAAPSPGRPVESSVPALAPAPNPVPAVASTAEEPAAPYVPPCCVELGTFDEGGVTFNARLVCEDPTSDANGQLVNVEVSEDGTEARMSLTAGDHAFDYLVPVCAVEVAEIEIPCCILEGRLWCPDAPDFHGMTESEVGRVAAGRLERCPEVPPTLLPPGCCAQRGEAGAILLCPDSAHPLHGYEIPEESFTCTTVEGVDVCEIWVEVPAPSGTICFDAANGIIVNGPHGGERPASATVTASPAGAVAEVLLGGGVVSMPACSTRQLIQVPLCAPPPVAVPEDCCFDVGSGALLCASAPDSPWNDLRVALHDIQIRPGGAAALVSHQQIGADPTWIPLCSKQVEDCCFELAAGPDGRIVCSSSNALDGLAATMLAMNGERTHAYVAWAGGASMMPLCSPVAVDPAVLCCVNLETGAFVCPGDAARHGRAAGVEDVLERDGNVSVRVAGGLLLPACGGNVAAPRPCDGCPPLTAGPECCAPAGCERGSPP